MDTPSVYIWNSMIRDMKPGLKVFDNIPKWNVVAWACLLAGYVNNNKPYEALLVFEDMGLEPNEIIMVNALTACAHSRDIHAGRLLHQCILKADYDPFMSTCNSTSFSQLQLLKCKPNVYERCREAFYLFFDMCSGGFCPDKVTLLSVFSVCAHQCALALGQFVHAYLLKTSIATDIALTAALIDMYAKTGELGSAQKIFNSFQKKDVVIWTSMINGLAMHGHGNEALSMFQTMQEDSCLVPDHFTYVGVLFACSHVGLVEEAQKPFSLMTEM
ncbi:hypothetical protein VNO78_18387 [Psophocarpus tetragonolobus]|uniref:Pentatricopeptide repeat-containing protein n=1 Tax=Psophocarpus tetragonolobus TaxID=3891 RepID=A0AAN9SJ84_PSOTE